METNGNNDNGKDITRKVLEYTNTCQQFSPNDVEYRFFTDTVKELTGASFVVLNLVSEKNENKTIVKSVSGAPETISKVLSVFGFNLEGTEWDTNYDAIKMGEKTKMRWSKLQINPDARSCIPGPCALCKVKTRRGSKRGNPG